MAREETEPIKLTRNRITTKYHEQIRQFFGLTQTCRLIRAEYHQMYMANNKFEIVHSDVYSYINTFVRTQDVKPKDITGNITLRMEDGQLAIDILPLITLSYSPCFKISYKIAAGPGHPRAILNTFMDVRNNQR